MPAGSPPPELLDDIDIKLEDEITLIVEETWRTNWLPTPKWAVARVTVTASWLGAWIYADQVLTNELKVIGLGIIAEAITAYVAPARRT